MKRIYKILIIAGVSVLIILGIYLGWRALTSGPEEEIGAPTTPDGEGPPSPSTGVVKKLSDEAAFDFWINLATREIFYLTPDGRVMNAKDGPDLEMSKQTISALNFIEVGPASDKILAAFGDPRTPQWGIFDVVDGVWRPLPADITNAAWGDNNEKLIVVVENSGILNLVEADLTNTPPTYQTVLRDFRMKDVKLTHVSENRLIVSELPAASYAGSIWQVDLENLNFGLLIAPQRGLDTSWSGDKGLVFLSSSESGFLVLDENLQIKVPTPFNTLPQKCTTDSSRVYCFVPQNVSSNTILPDDYFTKKFFSIDDLFTIEIESGATTRILSSNTAGVPAIDAKNPQVLGNKLYFVNRYDNGLYETNL